MKKVLIVCLGNICRSPTAEAVLRAKAKQYTVALEIDSAGTIDFHQGKLPDKRARLAGEKRGYSFEGIKSRPVKKADFEYFDYILAADEQNKNDLLAICPREYAHKIALFLPFSGMKEEAIPDPYYAGNEGFELVLDLLESASVGLLEEIR